MFRRRMANDNELKIDVFSTLFTHKSHRNCIELSNRFQARKDDSDGEDIHTGLDYEALVEAFEREMGRWDPLAENTFIQQNSPWSKKVFPKHGRSAWSYDFLPCDSRRLNSLHIDSVVHAVKNNYR
jgi:hypothetical protein